MKNIGKYAIIITFLAILISPNFASAQTMEELQNKIADLLKQLAQLQAQMAQMQGTTLQWCHDFNTDLKIGMGGSEVEALQAALEKQGFSINSEEKNNKKFDESTASTVSGLQQKYEGEILTPLGLKYPTGYFGKATRTKLGSLYGCAVKQTPSTTIETPTTQVCAQVITPAMNPSTLECKNFPTPCDVPAWWKKVDNCSASTPTTTVADNKPPTINGISGPTTLKINEAGTWTVKASDSEEGPLSYFVFWGSGQAVPMAVRQESVYSQTATFTNSYSGAGTYTLTFTVVDSKGLGVKSTINVQVAGETASTGTGTHKYQIISSSSCPSCPVDTICASTPCSSASSTIYNAKVSIYDGKGNYISAKDTSSGMAVFENLPYGTYTATISAEGYETDKGLFTVCAICAENTALFLNKNYAPYKKSIAVLDPNGGNIYLKGATYTTTWGAAGVNTVYIKLRKGNDTYPGPEGMISDIILNRGSYQWTVPMTLPDGDDYWFVVFDGTSGGPMDSSDTPFSIVTSPGGRISSVDQLANILESAQGILYQLLEILKSR